MVIITSIKSLFKIHSLVDATKNREIKLKELTEKNDRNNYNSKFAGEIQHPNSGSNFESGRRPKFFAE